MHRAADLGSGPGVRAPQPQPHDRATLGPGPRGQLAALRPGQPAADVQSQADAAEPVAPIRERAKPKRKPLPDHLPRQEVVHQPADDGACTGSLASFTADGAYDQDGVYAAVADRHPGAAVIVPPRATAVPSEVADTAPTQRDGHLRCIAETGRMGWQTSSGYNRRAKVEAAIGRWKQVIGDGLRARKDDCRATEVEVSVHVLNRMLRLGRPSYVSIA